MIFWLAAPLSVLLHIIIITITTIPSPAPAPSSLPLLPSHPSSPSPSSQSSNSSNHPQKTTFSFLTEFKLQNERNRECISFLLRYILSGQKVGSSHGSGSRGSVPWSVSCKYTYNYFISSMLTYNYTTIRSIFKPVNAYVSIRFYIFLVEDLTNLANPPG